MGKEGKEGIKEEAALCSRVLKHLEKGEEIRTLTWRDSEVADIVRLQVCAFVCVIGCMGIQWSARVR